MTSLYKAGKQEISSLVDGQRSNGANNTTFTDKNIRETEIVIYPIGRENEGETEEGLKCAQVN